MPLQHPTKTESRMRSEPGLQGVMLAPVLVGDCGSHYDSGPQAVFDEKSLWDTFMPSIRILGKEIPLGPDAPPLPQLVTDKILAEDEDYVRLEKLLAWLDSAASPADILALTHRLGNRG